MVKNVKNVEVLSKKLNWEAGHHHIVLNVKSDDLQKRFYSFG